MALKMCASRLLVSRHCSRFHDVSQHWIIIVVTTTIFSDLTSTTSSTTPPLTTTLLLQSTFSPLTATATSFATTLSNNPQPSASSGESGALSQLYQCAPCGSNTCSFSADVRVFVFGICHIILTI